MACCTAQRTVSFPAEDGGVIYGDQYGTGTRAVLLLHGGRFDRHSWANQARALTEHGFAALAIDFRGEGQSRGANSDENARYLDVLGAARYLKGSGAVSVSVVGASMGGDYAARAVENEPAQFDRVVLLASGAYTPIVRFHGPKLFVLAKDDANTEGLRWPRIRAQFEEASDPKKLILLEGSAHAQFLFDTPLGDRVMREILQFLSGQ